MRSAERHLGCSPSFAAQIAGSGAKLPSNAAVVMCGLDLVAGGESEPRRAAEVRPAFAACLVDVERPLWRGAANELTAGCPRLARA